MYHLVAHQLHIRVPRSLHRHRHTLACSVHSGCEVANSRLLAIMTHRSLISRPLRGHTSAQSQELCISAPACKVVRNAAPWSTTAAGGRAPRSRCVLVPIAVHGRSLAQPIPRLGSSGFQRLTGRDRCERRSSRVPCADLMGPGC